MLQFRFRIPSRFVVAGAALAALAQPAFAAPDVLVFADPALGAPATHAVAALATPARAAIATPRPQDAACAAAPSGVPGATPRFALLAQTPTRADMAACEAAAAADAGLVGIGRQAAALIVPAREAAFPVTSADLFRGLARDAAGEHPPSWRALSEAYPAAPIGLLLPPADSVARRVFAARVLETGCTAVVPSARLPFERGARRDTCASLRDDIAVSERGSGEALAERIAASPAGQVALVSAAELRALGNAVVALPIDGALPTARAVNEGRYPAARPVLLLVVLPHAATPAQREAARRTAFDLLGEAMIGPDGALAAADLVPLPAADRVEARSRTATFLE